jgi:hypothetical protein
MKITLRAPSVEINLELDGNEPVRIERQVPDWLELMSRAGQNVRPRGEGAASGSQGSKN